MFQIIYRECFSGFAVSRVKRDRDFTKNVGYFRNEYQIQYIIDGERYYFESGIRCVKMAAGSVAFIDKRRIPKLNIIGGRYHDRILIEIKEAEFAPICQAVGIDMERVFSQRCGVFQTGKCEEIRDVFEKRKDIDESMGGGSFCYHQLCLVGKRLPVHQDGVRPFTYRF